MTEHDVIIDNLDTLSDGVLDPQTRNFLGAYDDMRADLGVDLDNRLINLLAVIVHLGDMGEEEVSLNALKTTQVNDGTMPDSIGEGLAVLQQAGFLRMIDVIDDAEGDVSILLRSPFPGE